MKKKDVKYYIKKKTISSILYKFIIYIIFIFFWNIIFSYINFVTIQRNQRLFKNVFSVLWVLLEIIFITHSYKL